MSLENGEWRDTKVLDKVSGENFFDFIVKNTDNTEVNTGIQKTGDVEYDKENKALKFNESEDNETGEGGYLQLKKDGVSFKNGFTFEIYCNLDRLRYKNVKNSLNAGESLGLFCRMQSLKETPYYRAMRFGYTFTGTVCKFFEPCSWEGEGDKLCTYPDGSIISKSCGFEKNEDFYLTFVYRDYNRDIVNSTYDDTMVTNGIDRVEYYLDGEMFGYTYYSPDTYDGGRAYWDTSESKFFVGVCPWNGDGNLFYLQGNVFTTRLYNEPITPEQVKLNYDMTLKYRDSFKND